ncbi:COBRA-like protein 6 [Linum perenne]
MDISHITHDVLFLSFNFVIHVVFFFCVQLKVTILNYQQYRHIEAPGWRLGWDWKGKEAISGIIGAEATQQGDCSRFKDQPPPHCCDKHPIIIDLLPGAPYNVQTQNCCKGVPGYTCGNATSVSPTKIPVDGGRRWTQVLKTWDAVCSYSLFLASPSPKCCVSLSAFYDSTIVPCTQCSCGCQETSFRIGEKASVLQQKHDPNVEPPPFVRCTNHMCPVKIHWHVKESYRQYWRVKMTITNFNMIKNYTQWNLVVLHPNLKNITQVFSFNYAPLDQFRYTNDSGMFWGIKFYNDMLLQEGVSGNVQSEMLLAKEAGLFSFREGWAFPRRILFNGDECVMPPPDHYPMLPNSSPPSPLSSSIVFSILLFCCFFSIHFVI